MIEDFAGDIIDFIAGGIIGLLCWFFGGLDVLLKVLIVLTVIDYLSGLAAAWIAKTITSSIGFRGITKKCVMLTFVGIAHLLDTIIPVDGSAMRSVVCLFYIANEGKSIIENAYSLGIPIPQMLLNHFDDFNNEDKLAKQHRKVKKYKLNES